MDSLPENYVSMVDTLTGLFDKAMAELPDDQRKFVEYSNLYLKWDDNTPAQRGTWCTEWDYNHNPATKDEREKEFNLYSKQADIEREISRVEMFQENEALQRESKQRQLTKLNAELDAIHSKIDRLQEIEPAEPQTDQVIPAIADGLEGAPVTDQNTTRSNHDLPPGKQPNVAIGKLAVKAAWEIELKSGTRATAKEVIARLQEWADAQKHTETLRTADRQNKAVKWITSTQIEKSYSLPTCEKTLKTWNLSRA